MQTPEKTVSLSRRSLIKTAGATIIVAAVTPAGDIIGWNGAWAATPEALDPESYATLVQMSRDIYPHDRFKDDLYAAAVAGLDAAAKADAAVKQMLEDGVQKLDALSERMGFGKYRANAQEADRLSVIAELRNDSEAFFQKVRGNLVTGLYNNPDVWAVLGYEGESASKGGYINRGFDDIAWL